MSEAIKPTLLPCPFCGGEAREDAHAEDCYFTMHRRLNTAPGADLSLHLEVLGAWNRRSDALVKRVRELEEALTSAQQAINSMKVEAETAAQGDEQMMLEACETISNEGLDADTAIRTALSKSLPNTVAEVK